MKYRINIQSISDIITNSSSEVFTVYTDIPAEVIADWFRTHLRRWGYSEEEIQDDSTIGGNIYQLSPGTVMISYGVMCNVSEDIYGLLATTFGQEYEPVVRIDEIDEEDRDWLPGDFLKELEPGEKVARLELPYSIWRPAFLSLG